VWVPSYSHSPSDSTRLGTARKGGPTLHKRVARDKPSSKRVYRKSMQREAARKSGAIGAPFQTKARRSVKGADRPSGHKRATSMALGPCTANAASMALGPTRGPRPDTASNAAAIGRRNVLQRGPWPELLVSKRREPLARRMALGPNACVQAENGPWPDAWPLARNAGSPLRASGLSCNPRRTQAWDWSGLSRPGKIV
jgi:hypothetical protein